MYIYIYVYSSIISILSENETLNHNQSAEPLLESLSQCTNHKYNGYQKSRSKQTNRVP